MCDFKRLAKGEEGISFRELLGNFVCDPHPTRQFDRMHHACLRFKTFSPCGTGTMIRQGAVDQAEVTTCNRCLFRQLGPNLRTGLLSRRYVNDLAISEEIALIRSLV